MAAFICVYMDRDGNRRASEVVEADSLKVALDLAVRYGRQLELLDFELWQDGERVYRGTSAGPLETPTQ